MTSAQQRVKELQTGLRENEAEGARIREEIQENEAERRHLQSEIELATRNNTDAPFLQVTAAVSPLPHYRLPCPIRRAMSSTAGKHPPACQSTVQMAQTHSMVATACFQLHFSFVLRCMLYLTLSYSRAGALDWCTGLACCCAMAAFFYGRCLSEPVPVFHREAPSIAPRPPSPTRAPSGSSGLLRPQRHAACKQRAELLELWSAQMVMTFRMEALKLQEQQFQSAVRDQIIFEQRAVINNLWQVGLAAISHGRSRGGRSYLELPSSAARRVWKCGTDMACTILYYYL